MSFRINNSINSLNHDLHPPRRPDSNMRRLMLAAMAGILLDQSALAKDSNPRQEAKMVYVPEDADDPFKRLQADFDRGFLNIITEKGWSPSVIHARLIQQNADKATKNIPNRQDITILVGINLPDLAGTPFASFRLEFNIVGFFVRDCLTFTTEDLLAAGLNPDPKTGSIAGLDSNKEYQLSCQSDRPSGELLAGYILESRILIDKVKRLGEVIKVIKSVRESWSFVNQEDHQLLANFADALQQKYQQTTNNDNDSVVMVELVEQPAGSPGIKMQIIFIPSDIKGVRVGHPFVLSREDLQHPDVAAKEVIRKRYADLNP